LGLSGCSETDSFIFEKWGNGRSRGPSRMRIPYRQT
jgi:hypothetical protein